MLRDVSGFDSWTLGAGNIVRRSSTSTKIEMTGGVASPR
jgi:hypothetical protein